MSEEVENSYDCDKIAVPLSIKGKHPKVPFRYVFVNEVIPVLLGLALLATIIAGGVHLAFRVFDREDFEVVKHSDGTESVVLLVWQYNYNQHPPTEITLDEKDGKRMKSINFKLTPYTRNQLKKCYFNRINVYRFYYKKISRKEFLLQRVEEVK